MYIKYMPFQKFSWTSIVSQYSTELIVIFFTFLHDFVDNFDKMSLVPFHSTLDCRILSRQLRNR